MAKKKQTNTQKKQKEDSNVPQPEVIENMSASELGLNSLTIIILYWVLILAIQLGLVKDEKQFDKEKKSLLNPKEKEELNKFWKEITKKEKIA